MIKWTSMVSMYHDSFSCNIAFVASAFRGTVAVPSLEVFSESGMSFGGTTSDRSLTTSNVRGFSRWKSSSKYTLGIVDSGVGPCCVLRLWPELLLPDSIEVKLATDDTDDFRGTCDRFPPVRKRGSSWTSDASSPLASRGRPSSSLSLIRCSCSYSAPTCARYGLKSEASTCLMFVRGTGGISRAVGGL